MNNLPRAILFDLDDTILAAFGQAPDQWRRVVAAFIDQLAPHPPDEVVSAIQAYSRHLWSDGVRHKDWRPRIGAARRHIVSKAFTGLAGAAGRPVPPTQICEAIADTSWSCRNASGKPGWTPKALHCAASTGLISTSGTR
jgi:putative hydrolase of the HAD superfamily